MQGTAEEEGTETGTCTCILGSSIGGQTWHATAKRGKEKGKREGKKERGGQEGEERDGGNASFFSSLVVHAPSLLVHICFDGFGGFCPPQPCC